MEALQKIITENSITPYLIAVLLSAGVMILLLILKRLGVKRLSQLTEKTTSGLDDLIVKILAGTRNLFLLALAVYAGTNLLVLPENLKEIIRLSMIFILLLQVGFWINTVITYLIQKEVQKSQDEEAASQATTLSALGTVAKGVVWAVVIVLALDNIPGVEIGTLIASLGITGIAVGLAVQNILSDLFASLSIALDKPFVIGDAIVVDSFTGTIEKIGLKSTRLRSLTGEQLVFSNSDLLASRIQNYQRMDRRRVVLSLGLTYQTPYEKVREVPRIVEEIFQGVENCTFARAHFNEFGASSLNFEVVYWVESADYSLFMDIQQQVGLEIMKRFAEERIEFAYPTQTVILKQ